MLADNLPFTANPQEKKGDVNSNNDRLNLYIEMQFDLPILDEKEVSEEAKTQIMGVARFVSIQ